MKAMGHVNLSEAKNLRILHQSNTEILRRRVLLRMTGGWFFSSPG